MNFRAFGFPVRVDPSFLLVAIFGLGLGAKLAIAWVVIVFATTLIHELGHAFAFRAYGRGARVTLFAFGGFTVGDGGPLERGKRRAVSFAGPAASLVLIGVPAILLARLHSLSSDQHVISRMLLLVSIGWSVLNLLPILPLDGGQIASSILEERWGVSGAIAARIVSIVFAIAGAIVAVTHHFIFAAVFAALFIAQNFRELLALRDANTATALTQGHALIDQGKFEDASRIAHEMYAKAKTQPLKAVALELDAWALLAAGRRPDVGAVFEKYPPDIRPSPALMATILLLDGQSDAGLEASVEAIRTRPLQNGVLPIALVRADALMAAGRVLIARGGSEALERVAKQLDSLAHPAEAAALRSLLSGVVE